MLQRLCVRSLRGKPLANHAACQQHHEEHEIDGEVEAAAL